MLSRRARGPLLVLALVSAGSAEAEVQVNTYTTHGQGWPAVAAGADGSFVVVWASDRQTSSIVPGSWGYRFDLVGRRIAASGEPLGSEFAVSAYTTEDHGEPAIAADASGGFVVAWRRGGLEDPKGIFGRRFQADGTPKGDEFQIGANTFRSAPQRPAVASDPLGNFVVVWQQWEVSAPTHFRARRFDSTGSALGAEIIVGTGFSSLLGPAVAMDADGGFLVTWTRDTVVHARHYDAAGNPAAEFPVSERPGAWIQPTVASLGPDRFIVAWSRDNRAVLARHVAPTGPVGPEFQVNTHDGSRPAVAAAASGAHTLTWTEYSSSTSYDVFGQRFDAVGNRDGAEFRVNSYTTFSQVGSALALQAQGDFLVAWTSGSEGTNSSQDGEGPGVFAQSFRDALFADGFDSGGLGAWDVASTDGGDLAVQPRLDGEGHSFALRALVDDTAPLYVQDDTPQDEGRYRAAFEFDPNGFDPGEARGAYRVRIFLVLETNPTRRLVALVLKRQSGQYALRARVRLEDHSLADTPFAPISDGPHHIELDWIRSTRPDANNGSFSLWIDGTLASRLTGLDNTSPGVESVRLGAMAVKPGASGALWWDSFVSKAWSPIGPGVD